MAKRKRPTHSKKTHPVEPTPDAPIVVNPSGAEDSDNASPIPTGGPQFNQPVATGDPTKFTVMHGSDSEAYAILDKVKKPQPKPFPIVAGTDEPVVTLADAIGGKGQAIVNQIQAAGQIVFHSVGDTGNTKGPRDQDVVSDKMVSDFSEMNPREVPSFFFHLGDVVYSFGEAKYYYDQFYDPYRNYPAPIFAIAGNHDGMVAPYVTTPTLAAFLENFCQAGQPPHRTPESGELVRTAQVQPGVYFTLEAPFVRILALYSNVLEDPGVITGEGGKYSELDDTQVKYLEAALNRVKKEKFAGALIIAVHHPPYVAQIGNTKQNAGRHGCSLKMLADIDGACDSTGVWPHAIFSGHAHNYQRFTRTQGNRQTPFIVSGNGGHAVNPLTKKDQPTLRTPMQQPALSVNNDNVVFENYDDQDFGYMRVIADPNQLRIEYHPASDGAAAKTPDDFVTVDLKQRKLVHYSPALAATA